MGSYLLSVVGSAFRRMARQRSRIALAMVFALTAGCAGMERGERADVLAALAVMDHRVSTPHVELSWRCLRPEPGLLLFDGLVRNPSQAQPVRYFAAELSGIDAAGRTVSAGRGETADSVIRTQVTSPIRISLREAGREVRYDLFYRYDYQEMDDVSYRLASAAPAGFLTALREGFMVRDACNPAAHRAT